LHLHDDKTLQVRLFHQPDEQFLERSTETARFVLAAVAWNENVTAEEAARGLGVARDVVVNLLERFREGGVLVCEHQRYRIATPWWSVVWRFLRRKHLITLSPATA
jgi:DNA-binding IclR family transcriptional regulator